MATAQEIKPLRLGDEAPDFKAETTEGPISFHQWMRGHWCIFFSHPKDFTPVCTTELGATEKIRQELKKRGAKVISLSVDSLASHKRWIADINETQGTTLSFPMIADEDRSIARLYGMLDPSAKDTMTVRNLFIIDPNRKIRLMIVYPAAIGRNFDEIVRCLDAL